MLKLFNRKKKDNKGFTLVELVVVVAILAILVGLLAPQYVKYVEKSRKSADASNLENMVKAVEVAVADPEDSVRVKEGTYVITISSEKSMITKDSSKEASKTGDAAYDAIKETIGDSWEETKLKSVNWGKSGNSEISATIVVKTDGSFSTTYAPEDFAAYIGKDKTEN